jgi:anti-anti-sigma factor
MRITDGRSTATSQLSIERQAKADRLVLTLRGELDLGSGPRLRCELLEAESARCDGLVVDLRRLAFMDSAGLHVLLDAHKRARKNGRRFALLRGPREVQRTFELTHTDHLFTFDS